MSRMKTENSEKGIPEDPPCLEDLQLPWKHDGGGWISDKNGETVLFPPAFFTKEYSAFQSEMVAVMMNTLIEDKEERQTNGG